MNKRMVVLLICVSILVVAAGLGLVGWLFSAQYNTNGVSHFLVITIDETQPKEYVGELDGHDLYLEGLDPNETFFRSVDAKNVTLDEAFNGRLVSIDEWRRYALEARAEGSEDILRFANYEIAVSDNECVIRPIAR